MKKYKKILYVFLIVVIFIIGIFLYTTISKGNDEDEKEKSLAEVEYLEKKIVTLLNELNNIESRNYNLSVSEISKEDSSESNSGSSAQSESQTNTADINWENIKTEVENLYSPVPTITLDLYSLDIAKEDILGFNQELDNLTKTVQEENKENTLASLSTLYSYIPKFAEKVTDDTTYKAVVETKNNLFKAYSKLDSKNWNDILNDVKSTIDTFSNRLVNTNTNSSKQYVINKIYIMLNELQNAVNVQDESIFLIKYKNILEEMNNL